MSVTYDFQGQVALVTGAASGMGLATARAFSRAGAAVALADVSEEALGQAIDEIMAAGGTAIGVRCDVADEAEVAAMARPRCLPPSTLPPAPSSAAAIRNWALEKTAHDGDMRHGDQFPRTREP